MRAEAIKAANAQEENLKDIVVVESQVLQEAMRQVWRTSLRTARASARARNGFAPYPTPEGAPAIARRSGAETTNDDGTEEARLHREQLEEQNRVYQKQLKDAKSATEPTEEDGEPTATIGRPQRL